MPQCTDEVAAGRFAALALSPKPLPPVAHCGTRDECQGNEPYRYVMREAVQ